MKRPKKTKGQKMAEKARRLTNKATRAERDQLMQVASGFMSVNGGPWVPYSFTY